MEGQAKTLWHFLARTTETCKTGKFIMSRGFRRAASVRFCICHPLFLSFRFLSLFSQQPIAAPPTQPPSTSTNSIHFPPEAFSFALLSTKRICRKVLTLKKSGAPQFKRLLDPEFHAFAHGFKLIPENAFKNFHTLIYWFTRISTRVLSGVYCQGICISNMPWIDVWHCWGFR